MPRKWEYKSMALDEPPEKFWTNNISQKGMAEQEKQLNKFGNDGWELIYYSSRSHLKCYIILKREKKEVEAK